MAALGTELTVKVQVSTSAFRSEPDISPRPMNACTWSGAGAANIEIDATLLTVKPQMPTSGIEQAVSKFVDPLSGLFLPSARLKASGLKFQVKTAVAPEIPAQAATDLIATNAAENAAPKRFKPLIVPRPLLYFTTNSSAHVVGFASHAAVLMRLTAPPLSRQRQFSSSSSSRRTRVWRQQDRRPSRRR